ncbi:MULTISPECIES: cortex morphogenetic protein CmpA [Bacillaceae]|uniref:Cortex morphogenetic protein CmpA n=1 Tax=Evansella alkalicola TaxID=745819 RepID=A0ABS6K2A9_9BACI|nr:MULTISPECIES: cortex morphogenetic protein CmpA [Bacillaceae]MBU9723810.1 cortex morphogenetic protein CmpA [Bacillus alkalicola]
MPSWLQRQLQEAYQRKDRQRIKILNQCWFYYKQTPELSSTK